MKYKLTKAEQETVINFDNELDTKIQNCVWDVRRFILLTNLVID